MSWPRFGDEPIDDHGNRVFGNCFMEKWERFIDALRWSFGLEYFLTSCSDDPYPELECATGYPGNHFLQSYIARYGIVFLITLVDISTDLGGATFRQRLAELGAAVDSVYEFLRFLRKVEGYILAPLARPKLELSGGRESNEYKAKFALYLSDRGNPRRYELDDEGPVVEEPQTHMERYLAEQRRFDERRLGSDFRFPELETRHFIYPYPLRYKW
ncbi:hypothetical protein BJ508DRAFT_326274 [Ascobolus immersus RN42]|uniref:Uncharacterized protein n=1 Tax=Ascobolus immersus RN42 TaxID=1160509 RepID=A0A3N4IIW6_ASCIM|nr:hypothetical protein BJ508DRAFT_326274 [Ascobolus immersus RN42]